MKKLLQMIVRWLKMTFSFNVKGLTPQDANISTGGGGETPTGGVLPKNIAGLVMCLDGEINSRSGIHDESINGMQNLVYTPFVGNTSTKGVLEELSGTPTFTDKSCKLGGTMFVPCYQQTALTFEFVGSFDTNVFDNIISQQLFTNSIYVGGYQIFATSTGLNYQVFNAYNNMRKDIVYLISWEPNKTYHIAITDNFATTGATKFYINGEEVTTIINQDKTDGTCTTMATNIGVMGVHSTVAKSVYPVDSNGEGCFYGEYTNINAYRLWSRALNSDEIKQNYLQDKKRFG